MPFSIGDAVIVILLALAVGLAVFFIRRGKKSGGCSGCGGNCAGCPGSCGTAQNSPENKEESTRYIIPGEQGASPAQSGGFVKPYGDIAPPEDSGDR